MRFVVNISNNRGDDDEEAWLMGQAVPWGLACFQVPTTSLERPNDIGKVAIWVDTFYLRSSQRAVHIGEPLTVDWEWIPSDEYEVGVDKGLIRTWEWVEVSKERDEEMIDGESTARGSTSNGRPNSGPPSMIAFVQAPWILSTQDFKEFWRCSEMPMRRTDRLRSKHRLWAKVGCFLVPNSREGSPLAF